MFPIHRNSYAPLYHNMGLPSLDYTTINVPVFVSGIFDIFNVMKKMHTRVQKTVTLKVRVYKAIFPQIKTTMVV